MQKPHPFLAALGNLIRNFYFVSTLLFLVWILLLDNNNVFKHFTLNNKIEDLNQQRAYYEQQVDQLSKEIRTLDSNPEQLEKLVRERFLYKKKNEDIYVLEYED